MALKSLLILCFAITLTKTFRINRYSPGLHRGALLRPSLYYQDERLQQLQQRTNRYNPYQTEDNYGQARPNRGLGIYNDNVEDSYKRLKRPHRGLNDNLRYNRKPTREPYNRPNAYPSYEEKPLNTKRYPSRQPIYDLDNIDYYENSGDYLEFPGKDEDKENINPYLNDYDPYNHYTEEPVREVIDDYPIKAEPPAPPTIDEEPEDYDIDGQKSRYGFFNLKGAGRPVAPALLSGPPRKQRFALHKPAFSSPPFRQNTNFAPPSSDFNIPLDRPFRQEYEKGKLLEAEIQSTFNQPKAIHHLHETFTQQVEKEFVPMKQWQGYSKQFTHMVQSEL